MARFNTRLFASLLATLGLGLAGCGPAEESGELVEVTDTDPSAELGKADRPDLALRVIDGFTFSPALAKTLTRKVFTTAASFKTYFGTKAPATIDFTREWAVFYSAGLKPTRGYRALVSRVRLTDTGKTLKVTTTLESPGAGCSQAAESTVPSVLVAFARPSATALSASYSSADTVRPCTTSLPSVEPRTQAGDSVDPSCAIALQDVSRHANTTGGYEANCDTSNCWYVWAGNVDVAAASLPAGAKVIVAFRSAIQPGWFEVAATETTGAPAGKRRFAFRLADHTVGSGMSTTSLMRTRIEVAPAVVAGGLRTFDGSSADGGAFILEASNGWAVSADANRCAPLRPSVSTLQFLGGWRQVQHGLVAPGGQLTIDYDLTRLPECRNTHNGYPAWDTRAFVRFSPGGELVEGSVRAFTNVNGTPTNNVYAVPFTVTVPRHATRMEVWFQNTSGAGSTCATWDSQSGTNYVYSVEAAAPAPVQWAGDWGGSFARDCAHRDGLVEPIILDSYVMQRACSFVDVDVYVPGITDGATTRLEAVFAQVEWSLYGVGGPHTDWLDGVERVGNNYRFRWLMPRSLLSNVAWQTMSFTFRFSTDGLTWYRAGLDGGGARSVLRQF